MISVRVNYKTKPIHQTKGMDIQMKIISKVLSSLVKVFPDEEPVYMPENTLFTAMRNETISFQIAYYTKDELCRRVKISLKSPILKNLRLREVLCVPCSYPAYSSADDHYLRLTPGLYPDLLRECHDRAVIVVPGEWRSLWIDVEPDDDLIPGTYPVEVTFINCNTQEECGSAKTTVSVFDVVLPSQTLIRTEWFHGDCLADYYQIPVFSEEHWRIMENFIAAAVKRGINMIFTPAFTPPLDTEVGGERTTIQLVEVKVYDGKYSFGFQKLKRWVDMCKKVGIKYFEMSHLFTQWGAKHAPKVMAMSDGAYRQIFGWDTPATGGAYTDFLYAYLPELTEKLKEWEIAEVTYFHISDEPGVEHLGSYQAAKASVWKYLKDFVIMDALSDYEFYKTGAVTKPVSSNDHIQTFLDNGVKNMWSYYCSAQCQNVCNRFFSMPSVRNRIYAVQLFKYDIEGILHWGYNFYNTKHSMYHINPYQVTDSGGAFPGGDAFLVYPKEDGTPEESIRMMVLDEAMNDLRAFHYLASLTSRDYVTMLMEECLPGPVTFDNYPKSDYYLISLRNRVNNEIVRHISKTVF